MSNIYKYSLSLRFKKENCSLNARRFLIQQQFLNNDEQFEQTKTEYKRYLCLILFFLYNYLNCLYHKAQFTCLPAALGCAKLSLLHPPCSYFPEGPNHLFSHRSMYINVRLNKTLL